MLQFQKPRRTSMEVPSYPRSQMTKQNSSKRPLVSWLPSPEFSHPQVVLACWRWSFGRRESIAALYCTCILRTLCLLKFSVAALLCRSGCWLYLAGKCATSTLANKNTEHVLRFVPLVWTHAYAVHVPQMLRSTDRSSIRARATACAVTVHSERCPVLRVYLFTPSTLQPSIYDCIAVGYTLSFLHSCGVGQLPV